MSTTQVGPHGARPRCCPALIVDRHSPVSSGRARGVDIGPRQCRPRGQSNLEARYLPTTWEAASTLRWDALQEKTSHQRTVPFVKPAIARGHDETARTSSGTEASRRKCVTLCPPGQVDARS